MKEIKKISFLSAIFIVLGGTIGSGIFFKNTEILLVNFGSLTFTIISWLLASVGILFLIVSLGNISKMSSESSLGLLQWNKDFNSKAVYHMCRNFMVYFYLPFVSFGLSFYATQNIQTAFGWNDAEWWQIFLVSSGIILFFSITSGLKSSNASFINNILLLIKLIPMLFVIVFGIYKIAKGEINTFPLNDGREQGQLMTSDLDFTRPFLAMNPATGIFASVPAIYFTFDGFYKVTTMQKDLKNPKQISKIMVIGVFLMAGIYLILSVFLLISFDSGSIGSIGIQDQKIRSGVQTTISLMVAISIMGCMNANSIMGAKIYETVMLENGLRIFSFIKVPVRDGVLLRGNIIFNIMGYISLLMIALIGSFAFMNSSAYNYSSVETNRMYSFLDMIIGWASVLIFIMLIFPVVANIKKSKTKLSLFLSIVSVIFISSGLVFIILETFSNLIIMITRDEFYNQNSLFFSNHKFVDSNLNPISGANVYLVLNRNFIATIIKNLLLFLLIGAFSSTILVYRKTIKYNFAHYIEK